MLKITVGSKILLAAAALVALPTLSAAPITFAQFTQTTGTNAWVWTNPAGAANATFTATTNINFEYLSISGLPASLLGAQLAELTLTLSGPVLPNTSTFGPFLQQTGINGTLSVRRLTPCDASCGGALIGLDNLLTSTFTNADIRGTTGAGGANFNGSNHDLLPGTLDFTSDFINFSALGANDFAIGLSSLTPALVVAADGQLRSFGAAGAGTFSSEPGPTGPVPEPASMALFGGGLLAIGAVRFFRRK